ncbi:MAG TPA: DUF3488 and transglutaminase-like domain-containing protein [Acidiferrobacter sp.]|nr:DUF3488 and transglutaminase-like domain-containing protein [Acidiferrobacter sp.]
MTTPTSATPATLPAIVAILVALALAPLVGEIPWWATGAAGTFLAWRALGVRYLGMPSRAVRWLLAGLVILLVLAHYHTIFGERPGFSFLVMLLGVKCLEARDRRDFVMLVLLGYLALLGDLLFRPTLLMGLGALALIVASFVALSVIAQPQGPAMRARWRQGALLLLLAVPLALLAYIAFPRIAGGLWHGTPQPLGQVGLTPVLRPGSLAALLSSRAVAMRVIFQGSRPPREVRYFRAYVLTATNGRSWRAGAPLARPGTTGGVPTQSYSVLLNPTGNRVVPALDWPLAAPRGGMLEGGALVRARHIIRRVVRYELRAAPVRQAALTPAARRQDLALPADLDPRIRHLARRLARGAGGPRAIANRVLSYFVSHHFVYTLTPPAMGQDPTGRFLFTVRAGYCEDYASAFATLMRAAGVPTRIVVGFLGGEFNPDGGDVIVRDRDAHAWAEIWVAGIWRRVDPTAAVAPTALHEGVGALQLLLAQRAGHYSIYRAWWGGLTHHLMLWHDAATTTWDNWVLDYNWQRQEALLQRLGWRNANRVSLAVVTLALLILIGSAIKAMGGRTRPPSDPAHRIYERYCRRLARIGLTRRLSEGPVDYATRAARARPDIQAEVERITRAYVATRYAQDDGALADLRRQVRRFRPRRRAGRGNPSRRRP